jgi:hypothetical protein
MRAVGTRRTARRMACLLPGFALLLLGVARPAAAQFVPVVPESLRGTADAERKGFHDAANMRTEFYNFGMVGNYPQDPLGVDLSTFHSVEVPKGSGMNYSDGITPFVLSKIIQRDGTESYIMETGYRERQGRSPQYFRDMRFEPRPGFIQKDVNRTLSPPISSDPDTWPDFWPDKENDPDDPGWVGKWNGYFGKRAAADQESFTVMDDQYYDAWDYRADSRDSTRLGLGLRVEVRGFQWANPQAANVIFWHYDITNESTTDYDENIVFGLYMDSGVGGSAESCDRIPESDDDNAYFDRTFDQNVINLVYTWDKRGHGRSLTSNCGPTGYLGYAYLETPGKALDEVDNDEDGITDEKRDGGPGEQIRGQDAIRAYVQANYDLPRFVATYGALEKRPAFRIGSWWTGDEDMDWVPDLHDAGADGVFNTGDTGEGDGKPTPGETNFDRTDLNESDQIGLTGFKMNRIRAGQGTSGPVDNVLFFTNEDNWPQRLYEQFTDPNASVRFDAPLVLNYNIAFLFASGPFTLKAGKTERFSLALAYGGGLDELRRTVQTVQQIYNANYQFAVPPPAPTVTAESGDGYVRLSWDDLAERGVDPVTGEVDFEGYRVYRSTDPEFRDPRVITNGTGTGPIGNGKPSAQFDLVDGKKGYSTQTVEGVAYYLGTDTGISHTWTDSSAVNGQEYFYAVTAYDYGSDSLNFYPSENSIPVSRTPRGEINLPINVVQVRPEPPVLGYVPASTGGVTRLFGDGTGTVDISIVNSNEVPENHLFKISFATPSPTSLRATSYALTDSTTGKLLFKTGRDLQGRGVGPVASGILPIISTLGGVAIDSTNTGFAPGSPTDVKLKLFYLDVLPRDQSRPGYPEDLSIIFDDAVVDTSLDMFLYPPMPAKFRVVAHGPDGDHQLRFRFRDLDGDANLSTPDEFFDIVTYAAGQPDVPSATWRAQIDTTGTSGVPPTDLPGTGDVYNLALLQPFGADDVFLFTSHGERIDDGLAASQQFKPYVVPNPYVSAASFEPERFAVSGRGERRIEFRGLPRKCTIRIYTVHGDLVQTLEHDGSDDGVVPWNLRTRDNLDIAPGLYVFHVEAPGLGTSIGKFALIK